jgi:hypothetical protein
MSISNFKKRFVKSVERSKALPACLRWTVADLSKSAGLDSVENDADALFSPQYPKRLPMVQNLTYGGAPI